MKIFIRRRQQIAAAAAWLVCVFAAHVPAEKIVVAGDSRIGQEKGICQTGMLLDMLKQQGHTAVLVTTKCVNYYWGECKSYDVSINAHWKAVVTKVGAQNPDVVYWSAGLDDVDGMGAESAANYTKRCEDYRKTVVEGIDLLKQKLPNAQAFFSTQLPIKTCGIRRAEDIVKLNSIAKEVCGSKGLPVHDLNRVAADNGLQPGSDCRHYSKSANVTLARSAADYLKSRIGSTSSLSARVQPTIVRTGSTNAQLLFRDRSPSGGLFDLYGRGVSKVGVKATNATLVGSYH